MNRPFNRLRFGALLMAAALTSGCIGNAPNPEFAQPGGIVNINLGGIKRNTTGTLITTADFVAPTGSVTITDALSNTHDVRLVRLFRVFPDHTSKYAIDTQDRSGADPNAIKLTPHDGALWLTIALCSPAGAVLSSLEPGPGFLSISSPVLTQTNDVFHGVPEGDYTNIPITIADAAYPFCQSFLQTQSLAYESSGYLTLQPSAPIAQTVGGAQIDITFDCKVTRFDFFQLRLVPMHHNPNVSLVQNVTPVDSCAGTGTLTAVLSSPDGFAPSTAAWTQGQGTTEDLQLAMVSKRGSVVNVGQNDLAGCYTWSGYYFDMNGDQIAGVTPELSNEFVATGGTTCP